MYVNFWLQSFSKECVLKIDCLRLWRSEGSYNYLLLTITSSKSHGSCLVRLHHGRLISLVNMWRHWSDWCRYVRTLIGSRMYFSYYIIENGKSQYVREMSREYLPKYVISPTNFKFCLRTPLLFWVYFWLTYVKFCPNTYWRSIE